MNSSVELDPSERTRCEVWTRVMGYHRPLSAFNRGKQAEHAERTYFDEGRSGAVAAQRRRREQTRARCDGACSDQETMSGEMMV